ncbi:MAG TPA: cell envelope integrity protein TolA [Methyloceanibacter sp.]|nr:cell envelope integrity protein TolA [Methyloceanibacter sp.]
MGRGTFISAALHGAILLWVLVAFPPSNLDKAPLVAIPIDLASQADVTKVKAGTKDAKDEGVLSGKPEEKKPEAAKEAKPPEQTASLDDKAEDKKNKPKPDAQKQDDKTAKDPKQAAADPPKKPKPQAKKRDFNPDKIAALLNKIPDAADDPKPVMPDDGTPPKKVKGQTNGTEITMSVNEIDALRARIADCWTPPPGGLGADQIVVKLRLKLKEDGTLVGYPTVANSGSSPFFQAAADSAVRAVYQCQPYELPKAKYALWRDMILNFDPSDMYRSG